MATSMAGACAGQSDVKNDNVSTPRDDVSKRDKKSFKSAVCIIPPEEVWQQIQDIRKNHDKAYDRWMPHINLLYPFLPDTDDGEVFAEAADKIKQALSHVKPFRLSFSQHSLGYFERKKNCTLWLQPLTVDSVSKDIGPSDETKIRDAAGSSVVLPHHPEVLRVQNILEETFPDCADLSQISESGFQPHLSLGQFKAPTIRRACEDFRQNWQEIQFEVKEVSLISRKDFYDPFHVRHRVAFGANAS